MVGEYRRAKRREEQGQARNVKKAVLCRIPIHAALAPDASTLSSFVSSPNVAGSKEEREQFPRLRGIRQPLATSRHLFKCILEVGEHNDWSQNRNEPQVCEQCLSAIYTHRFVNEESAACIVRGVVAVPRVGNPLLQSGMMGTQATTNRSVATNDPSGQ